MYFRVSQAPSRYYGLVCAVLSGLFATAGMQAYVHILY